MALAPWDTCSLEDSLTLLNYSQFARHWFSCVNSACIYNIFKGSEAWTTLGDLKEATPALGYHIALVTHDTLCVPAEFNIVKTDTLILEMGLLTALNLYVVSGCVSSPTELNKPPCLTSVSVVTGCAESDTGLCSGTGASEKKCFPYNRNLDVWLCLGKKAVLGATKAGEEWLHRIH